MTATTLSRRLGGSGQDLLLLLAAIVLLLFVAGWINPRFVSPNNLTSIFVGNAYVAVAAIGMWMVIISGHIDVSVGALIVVLATISGLLVTNGYPVWAAWLVPVLVGGPVERRARRGRRLSQGALDHRDARRALDPARTACQASALRWRPWRRQASQ